MDIIDIQAGHPVTSTSPRLRLATRSADWRPQAVRTAFAPAGARRPVDHSSLAELSGLRGYRLDRDQLAADDAGTNDHVIGFFMADFTSSTRLGPPSSPSV